MSGENDNVDSSLSSSDIEQNSSIPKSGFRGEGESILPVRNLKFYKLHNLTKNTNYWLLMLL